MKTLASRRKTQAPPPSAMFEALTQPRRKGARPWLFLTGDEEEPTVLEAQPPSRVVWSSLWQDRPDDRIVFLIDTDPLCGSVVEWQLQSESEAEVGTLRHLRYRLNELVNRDLRNSFDQ